MGVTKTAKHDIKNFIGKEKIRLKWKDRYYVTLDFLFSKKNRRLNHELGIFGDKQKQK